MRKRKLDKKLSLNKKTISNKDKQTLVLKYFNYYLIKNYLSTNNYKRSFNKIFIYIANKAIESLKTCFYSKK